MALAGALLLAAIPAGSAQTLTTLASFNGTNGSAPVAPLVQGTDGNFYGTTPAGGSGGFGTVFQMTPSGTLTTLYSFLNGADGSVPNGLVQGSNGNFYGTTSAGGANGNGGAVFSITPGGALTTLYSFCAAANCADGSASLGGLVKGNDGNFYGTTSTGGAFSTANDGSNGLGTVFQITPTGTFTSLYSFKSTGGDGQNPNAGLILHTDGKFYGTTLGVMNNICGTGTIFSITPAGAEAPVYGLPCASAVLMVSGPGGFLYGTMPNAVFQFQPSVGETSTVSSFAAAWMIRAADGNFYGTNANNEGPSGGLVGGTVFRLTPTGTLTTLYTFCVGTFYPGCADGKTPGGLIQGSDGNFYGTTSQGGASGNGAIFRLNVSLLTISGQVTLGLSAQSGVTMTLSGSQSASTVTDTSGNYSFTVAAGGAYTVTPSSSGDTFSPASTSFSNLSSNQTANFSVASTSTLFIISGQVVDSSGNPLSGVTVSFSRGGSVLTDASGNYSFNDLSGTGVLTPSLCGQSFSPPSLPFENLLANQTQNFTTSPVAGMFSISGQVGGSLPFTSFPVSLSGSQSDSTETDLSGNYSFCVAAGGSYTVHVAGDAQTFNNLSANQTANFFGSMLTFTPLATFAGTNGQTPRAPLILGADGNLYGTTSAGGTAGAGAIFSVTPGGALTSLYNFTGAADGGTPLAPVLQGNDGNFYGTTSTGGSNGFGTIFQMTPAGAVTTLHAFAGSTDGATPFGGLILAADGKLYGTASAGGASNAGTVFSITPSVPAQFTTLYSFCAQPQCTDGLVPFAPLVQGTDGNLYGTTAGGGVNCIPTGATFGTCGTIFKITTQGAIATLYNFTGLADGSAPVAGLIQWSEDGNFYGTTTGINSNGQSGNGTVFQITPAGLLTVLHDFTGGIDGSAPFGALVAGPPLIFYGTTSGQNSTGHGTIFQIDLSGFLDTLYTFTGGADGGDPTAGLVRGSGANYYVTTSQGGANGDGTVFEANLGLAISGQVTLAGVGLAGVGVASLNATIGFTDTATTDSAGRYIFIVGEGGTYTITPQAGSIKYTFSPASQTFTNVSASQTQNFAANQPGATPFTISGQVTLAGSGLSGVTMTLSGSESNTTTTDGSGNYSFSAPAGGNYTVTPSLIGNAFGPASQTFASLSGSQTLNFPASASSGTFTISGQVTLSGSGLSGVGMTLSGSQNGTTSTDASGNYSFSAEAGGNYTVTPSLSDDSFSPPSATFNNLSANQTQNFAAVATTGGTFTISGQVTVSGSGLSGVTMTLSGSQSATATTDGSGNYTFTEAAGGSYTVTPSLSGDTFSPASQTFNNLSANQTQNFTASATTGGTFTISGQVTLSGSGLSGVTMTLSGSQSGSTTTDSSGNYTFTEAAGGSYTVTPSLAGDTFSPPSQAFNNVSANQTQNFAASATTGGTFTISGQVTDSGGNPLTGVTMTLSSSPKSPIATITDGSGNYSFSVPAGGNYTVTPSLGSDTFNPPNQAFTNLSAGQTQNFTGSPFVLSGNNGFTVTLAYQFVPPPSGPPPAGASLIIAPNIPGFTIAPFGSQDIPIQAWNGTVTANFTASPYSGMRVVGSMPHLASGGGQWTTAFTLLNNGAVPANVTLNFFDDNGNPLRLPVTFPQTTAGVVTDSTFTGPLNAGQGLLIQTAGLNNPLSTGWAQLLSDGDVSGFAVFTDNVTATQQQQAVVPLQSPILPAYLLWFDNTSGFSTGVALANESTSAATVNLVMRDDLGAPITKQSIQLPALGHTSFALASTAPATANLRGTMEVDESANSQVSVLGLSFNPASAFTSIPVAPLPGGVSSNPASRPAASASVSQPRVSPVLTNTDLTVNLSYQFGSGFAGTPPPGAEFTIAPHVHGLSTAQPSQNLAFLAWNGSLTGQFPGAFSSNGMSVVGTMPHLASGGNQWTTAFTLLNTGTATANVELVFLDDNGNPLPLPLTFPQGSPDQTTASFTGAVVAGAAGLIQTAGLNGPLVSGWAQLLSDGDVTGFAVFTDNVTAQQQQQAVVPLQGFGLGSSYVLWFDNTNGFSTGVALGYVGNGSVNLTIKDDTGTILNTQTIQVPSNGHTAFNLATFAPVTANLRGTLEFSPSNAAGLISVLGLSFNPASAFTSIPAIAP
jgi:uncharacterized repeat protein (TIGR03803 family)